MSTTQSLAPPDKPSNQQPAVGAQPQPKTKPEAKAATNLGPALKIDPTASITNATPAHTFLNIPIGRIVPSNTNPRKSFDGPDMAELVESIRQCGVIQPALVRTRTANATDILRRGSILPLEASKHFGRLSAEGETVYEIVAGERRYRAAVKAGLKELPAMVRPLSDGEVLELQIVENLQRKDVSPLEESAGYVALFAAMQKEQPKIARQALIEQIAKRIGKSVRYVYARMKLDELIPDAKQALREGRIAPSHADELVRLTAKDQQEIFEADLFELTGQHFASEDDQHFGKVMSLKESDAADREHEKKWGVATSIRKLKAVITANYCLELKKAPFALDDARLKPMTCAVCPKNTANSPLLHPDVTVPTCTDKKCFHEKRDQFVQIKANDLKAVVGDVTKVVKVTPAHWGGKDGVIPREGWKAAKPGSCQHVLVAQVVETSHEQGKFQRATTVCTDKKCKVHFGKKPERAAGSSSSSSKQPEQTRAEVIACNKQDIKFEIARGATREVFKQALAKVSKLEADDLRFLVEHQFNSGWCNSKEISEVTVMKGSDILNQVSRLSVPELSRVLLALAFADDLEDEELSPDAEALAKRCGVDRKKIESELRSKVKACSVCSCTAKFPCSLPGGKTCALKGAICSNPLCGGVTSKPTEKAKAPAAKRGTSAPKKKSAKRAAAKTAKKGGR